MNNWYDIVSSTENISQGDILFNCPIFIPDFPKQDLTTEEWAELDKKVFDTIVVRANVIVLTQACDLEVRLNSTAPKITTVTVAAMQDARKNGVGKSALISFAKLNKSEIYLLDPCYGEVKMGHQLVRFEHLHNLPWKLINDFSKTQKPRLRLKSPYIEQLLQHFGMHFGRVSIPENREDAIKDFYSYKDIYDEQRKHHDKTWQQLTDDEMFAFIAQMLKLQQD